MPAMWDSMDQTYDVRFAGVDLRKHIGRSSLYLYNMELILIYWIIRIISSSRDQPPHAIATTLM